MDPLNVFVGLWNIFTEKKELRANIRQVFLLSLYHKSVLSVLELKQDLNSFLLCNLTMLNNTAAVSSQVEMLCVCLKSALAVR